MAEAQAHSVKPQKYNILTKTLPNCVQHSVEDSGFSYTLWKQQALAKLARHVLCFSTRQTDELFHTDF